VVQYRLESEYGAEARLEPAGFQLMRWISPDTPDEILDDCVIPSGGALADDTQGQPVILLPGEWAANYFIDKNPDIKISDLPFKELHSAAK